MEERRKRKNYNLEVKLRVGAELNRQNRRGQIIETAQLLNVSVRTLRNWKNLAKLNQTKKIGRPRHGIETHRKAMWTVARELRMQGYVGWRLIKEAVGDGVPTLLVQKYTALLKAKRKKRIENLRAQMRIKTEVLYKNTIWGQDSTELQKQMKAEIIKDRGTLKLLSAQAEKRSTTAEAMSALKNAAAEQKTLPLVLMTDNGSEYVSEEMKKYLHENKVIHLRSLPRTPQHNGATENSVRETKDVAAECFVAPNVTVEYAQLRLLKAQERINHCRLRASKGYKTSKELDDTIMKNPHVDRTLFYDECSKRINEYVRGVTNAREIRQAEREAVHVVLEEYGFIKRTRGGQFYAGRKRENIC